MLALFLEERDLVELHGRAYPEYQRRVPKLLPFVRPAAADGEPLPGGPPCLDGRPR